MDQLILSGGQGRPPVDQDGGASAFEGDSPEAGYQWFLAGARDGDLEASAWPLGRVRDGLVLAGHRGCRGAVLRGQGFEHRFDHHPFQPFEAEDVLRQQVVLDHTAVLGPVLRDDRVVLVAGQQAARCRLARLRIQGTPFFGSRRWARAGPGDC